MLVAYHVCEGIIPPFADVVGSLTPRVATTLPTETEVASDAGDGVDDHVGLTCDDGRFR